MLFLFDNLKDKFHTVGMDNQYLSLKFCQNALIVKNQTMIHGVAHKNNQGHPACVAQEKQTNKKSREDERND
jgi:hypothetical protein